MLQLARDPIIKLSSNFIILIAWRYLLLVLNFVFLRGKYHSMRAAEVFIYQKLALSEVLASIVIDNIAPLTAVCWVWVFYSGRWRESQPALARDSIRRTNLPSEYFTPLLRVGGVKFFCMSRESAPFMNVCQPGLGSGLVFLLSTQPFPTFDYRYC